MSYGLTFADPRQAPDEARKDTAPSKDVWRRVAQRIGSVVDGAKASRTRSYGQLTDEKTGLDIHLTATSASISLPYWHYEQPEAAIVMLYEVAGIVEEETGLSGTDPQVGMSVREAGEHLDLVVSLYANAAAMFERNARTQARIAARRAQRG